MVDNLAVTPGTGATVAADDIAGVMHQRVKIGIGADGAATDWSSANPAPVVQTASEVHVGEVGGKTNKFDVTLSLDTAIYASGDVLADSQICNGLLRKVDGTGTIQDIVVIDQDDQKAAFDIYFLDANVAMGTENAAPSISDANALNILGYHSVAVADYKDLGGVSIASFKGVGITIKAVSGTDDIYVAVVNGTGTPTYTASGVKLRLGVLLD